MILSIIKLSSNRRKLYFLLRKVLGYYPNKLSLYERSLIHKSHIIKDNSGKIINNERLEFLGDAILGSIIAQELYQRYPDANEGLLTKTRSRIVNRNSLNKTAVKLGLEKIIVSQSKIALDRTNIPGDALEALIGAIFVDKGYNQCAKFVLNKILNPFVNINDIVQHDDNFKSVLIEWGDKNKHVINFITEEASVDINKNQTFISKVEVDSVVSGTGKGNSKKEAQQNAAMEALHNIQQ